MITSSVQAEQIIGTGQADAILIAREFLRDPLLAIASGPSARAVNFVACPNI